MHNPYYFLSWAQRKKSEYARLQILVEIQNYYLHLMLNQILHTFISYIFLSLIFKMIQQNEGIPDRQEALHVLKWSKRQQMDPACFVQLGSLVLSGCSVNVAPYKETLRDRV